MLGAEGGSLGASGVIFGLLAVAMVWAPENEVECLILIFPWFWEVEVSIKTLAFVYLALQVPGLLLVGLGVTSAALHLLGFAVGLPIGIVMLLRGWVDCEGWDWFSRRKYRPMPVRGPAVPAHAPAGAASRAQAASAGSAPAAAPRRRSAGPPAPRFGALLAAGDVAAALRLHDACSAAERSTLPLQARERLLFALFEAGSLAEARALAQGLLRDDPGHPVAGLLEAEQLLRERRPSKADEVLAAVEGRLADERQRATHADLAARADALCAAGVLEFDD